MKKSLEQLKKELAEWRQEHLLQYYSELSESEKDHLLTQLSEFDFAHLNQIFAQSMRSNDNDNNSHDFEKIEPPPKSCIDSLLHCLSKSNDEKELYHGGLEFIGRNQVAIVLLAGGQGTRLGSKLPKGLYDMQLLSHKTLFQLQTERIVRLQQLAALETNNNNIQIPYYILTSPQNYEETKQYFMDNAYFGLAAEQVYFFNQDSLPCFSLDGKILLESKCSMALAPNGNGGVYQALERNGLFSDMKKRGIKHIHSYSVDNVLVKPADPVFMALCSRRQVEFGTKVVPKRDAHERVGIFALKNNRFHVVEYSEISKAMAERIDPETKQLAFNAANIVNFYYSFDFIVKCAQIMKTHRIYHVAKKCIPVLNPETGKTMEPRNGQNNGIKLELFNFDICEFADKVAILEVDRTMEFSPLKNEPNEGLPDSPETCRRDLSRVSKLYIERAGGRLTNAGAGNDDGSLLCEVSPLLSYGGEGLEPIVKGKVFTLPLYLV